MRSRPVTDYIFVEPFFLRDIYPYLHRHRLRTPGEENIFTARPKIKSQSQIFRYDQSIFCLSHRPKISDLFDLCLHWVSVVCVHREQNKGIFSQIFDMGLTLMIFFISRIVKAQSWAILAAVRENFFYFANSKNLKDAGNYPSI